MRYFPLTGPVLSGLGLTALQGSATACTALLPPDTLLRRPWYVPHQVVVQLAGGQGLATIEAGYSVGHNRLELDGLAGYVPRKYSITAIDIFTAKATYMPWTVPLRHGKWALQPLALGGHINYTASQGLNTTRDDKYPADYYWWSARTRVGGFVGGRIAYGLPSCQPAGPRRHASLYYELGSNDLYLTSWWGNPGSLSLGDVLTLAIGVKLEL